MGINKSVDVRNVFLMKMGSDKLIDINNMDSDSKVCFYSFRNAQNTRINWYGIIDFSMLEKPAIRQI